MELICPPTTDDSKDDVMVEEKEALFSRLSKNNISGDVRIAALKQLLHGGKEQPDAIHTLPMEREHMSENRTQSNSDDSRLYRATQEIPLLIWNGFRHFIQGAK